MTPDDIIRMGREAGVRFAFNYSTYISLDELCAFAGVVAAAECEACAQLVDHILCEGGGTYGDAIRARGKG